MNINKAIIVGRITRQPELKVLGSGTPVASFSVATNRTYTKDGQRQEDTEFHNIVVFGKTAETCAQYLAAGQEVGIEGRIQTRSWDDQNSGSKKYRTEIVAESVQFGSKAGGNAGESGPSHRQASKPVATPPSERATIDYPDDDINVDDIPF